MKLFIGCAYGVDEMGVCHPFAVVGLAKTEDEFTVKMRIHPRAHGLTDLKVNVNPVEDSTLSAWAFTVLGK
jgi:hypothetical protein